MKYAQKSKQLLSFKKKSVVTLLGLFGFLLFFVSTFLITRGEYPHTSELAFIEHSVSGAEGGSVVPASCNSAPPTSHFLNDCTAVCPSNGLVYDPYLNAAACPVATPIAAIGSIPANTSWNGSGFLTWSSTGGATGCTATGDWTGARAASGTLLRPNLTSNQTYGIYCSVGAVNSPTVSTTITVCPSGTPIWNGTSCVAIAGAPTAAISLVPINVSYNASTTISWSSTNSTSCTASGSWSGAKAISGYQVVGNLTSDQTYDLYCSNAGADSVTETITVNVCPSGTPTWNGTTCTVTAGAPTAAISSTPTNISYGGASTILWNSTNATGCTSSGDWTAGPRGIVGTYSTSTVTSNKTFTLLCSDGVTDSPSVSTTLVVCPVMTPTWNGTSCIAPVGNITSNACTIATGANTCSMNVAWSVTNPSGVVSVVRPYAGNTIMANGPTGNSSYVFPYSATPYTLDLYDVLTKIDDALFTASCAVGGYDTIGAACANPSGVATVTGDIYGPGFFNFTCTNANRYTVRRDGTTIVSQDLSGTYVSGTPISLPIAITGNYQVECIQGDYGALVPAVLFSAPPPPDADIFISATPRTIAKDSSVTLRWNIRYPVNACTLTAKVVCTNGICSTAQLAAQTTINTILSAQNTDLSDPVGPRPIPTAVNTIAAGYAATYQAVGRKTVQVSNTMDFTIDCGVSSKKATTRVLVTKSNEQ